MKHLIITCLFLISKLALAQPVVAMVLATTNKVIAGQGQNTRDLARGASLYAGEEVTTMDQSQAKIKYTNGTFITLEANSHFTVSDPNASPTSAFDANLQKGTLTYQSSGSKKGKLKTSVVSLGILGTTFQAEVVSGSSSTVTVTEGKVKGRNIVLGPCEPYYKAKFTPTAVELVKTPKSRKDASCTPADEINVSVIDAYQSLVDSTSVMPLSALPEPTLLIVP